jgi:hypothetical protein
MPLARALNTKPVVLFDATMLRRLTFRRFGAAPGLVDGGLTCISRREAFAIEAGE